jgi:hypothetical protein
MQTKDALGPLAAAKAQNNQMMRPLTRALMPKPATSGLRHLIKWVTSLSTTDFHPAIHGTITNEFLEAASTGQALVRKIKPMALAVRFTVLANFDRSKILVL